MGARISRRAFLRGIGGTVIALPALEIMGETALRAGGLPLRYLVCFDGQSLGADGDASPTPYIPTIVGPGYDLKRALLPLAPVRDDVSVVSGLQIPTAGGGAVPPGGRIDDFHINSLSPLFSGMRKPADGPYVNGATSDQVVAAAIAGNTVFRSLVYRVQAEWYLSVSAPYGRDMMSYKLDGGGRPQGIPATVSPRAAWTSLFANYTGVDPQEVARRAFLLRQRKSILDLVDRRGARLLALVGQSDRDRLQRHYDEVRDLERRVSAIPPDMVGQCMQTADPGVDPPIGGAQGVDGNGDNTYATNLGYSDEDDRARVMCDLIHMAFTCDLTRVGSLMFSMAQSHMNMFALTGHPFDLHELGHSSNTDAVADGIAWHMKHFAYLIEKFKGTPEGSGSLLDSCAIVMLHEGGHGLDTSSGKQNSSHSTENMACLIAGRAGGLKPGKHVVASGKHPANVLITAMNAVGVPGPLGEVSGDIPELRT